MRTKLRIGIGTIGNTAAHGAAVLLLVPQSPTQPGWINALEALAVTWVILSFVFFQFQLTPLRFPKTWYRITAWEKNTAWYRWLGVPLFRYLLIHSPFRWLNPKLYVRGGGRDELERLVEFTREAETAHVLDALLTFVLLAVWWVLGYTSAALYLLLFNVIFNAYPIALQRFTRLRLDQILRASPRR